MSGKLIWRLTAVALAALGAAPWVMAQPAATPGAPPSEQLIVLKTGTIPEIKKVVRPRYPMNAAGQGFEGYVKVQFDVDERGRVRDPEIADTVVDGRVARSIERAAMKAVRSWRFEPAIVDGEPVPYKSFIQTINFSLSPPGGLSERFQERYRAVAEALDAGDLAAAQERFESLVAAQQRTAAEHGMLALANTMMASLNGQSFEALEAARRGLDLLEAPVYDAARLQLLRLAMLDNAKLHRYREALEYYDRIGASSVPLPEDAPEHRMAEDIRAALAGEDPIVREGVIGPCTECRDTSYFYTARLNRDRFTLEADAPAVIERFTVRCGPSWTRLAWTPNTVWKLKNDHADCKVTVRGRQNAKVRLVELASSTSG